jgi:trans-aconitate methyltransferase
MHEQTWQPSQYRQNASFVSRLGSPVVDLLQPRPGERILDLGCGDGTLASNIESVGAKVVGVDSSREMVTATQACGIEAHVMSGDALTFRSEFDAVFTNATLHWIKDYQAVIRGVWAALKPDGSFVGEFGAHGNVSHIVKGIERVFATNPDFGVFTNPWFFPTEEIYRKALEEGGFKVDYIQVIPRPTPLATGMREWLKIFADHVISRLSEDQTNRFLNQVEEEVRHHLYSPENGWVADYVRLRFAAVKTSLRQA